MSLVVLLLVPFLIGMCCLTQTREAARPFAIAGSLGHLLLALWVVSRPEWPQFQLAWLPSAGLSFSLGVDGAGYLLLVLTPLLTTLALILTPLETERAESFYGLLLILSAALTGLFLADNLLLFYFFFEVMLLPALLLTARWGGPNGRKAAFKFFLFTMAGSLPMLFGVLFLASLTDGNLDFSQLRSVDPATQRWLFVLFALAFSVKTPLVPFHGWLVDLYRSAPPQVTAVVAAVMSKAGVYGFIKVGLLVFPEAMASAAPVLLVMAVIGVLYGGFCALGDPTIKGTLAYSSLSHMGMIVMGLVALNRTGLSGGTLQMLNHGLATGGLFLVVAVLAGRGLSDQLDQNGGLAQSAPRLAVVFLFLTMASLGVPGLCSYPGELLILTGLFREAPRMTVLASLGIVIAAWYLLRLYQGVMHGPSRQSTSDLSAWEFSGFLPLLVLVVVVGAAPGVWLDPVQLWMETAGILQ